MADTKISALSSATTPLAGTEVLPIVQSGVTKKASIESVLTSAQPSGTANGVAFLNASKVLTTVPTLTFDGTNFGIGTSSPMSKLTIAGEIAVLDTFALRLGGNQAGGATLMYNSNGNLDITPRSGFNTVFTAGAVTMSAYGVGTATFNGSGVISSVSDETWKIKDGAPIDPDLMINALQPGYWYYNDDKKLIFGEERQLGFYAQNVNAAIGPEAAPEPEEGKPWGYYDRSVLAVTVLSLQKALATIETLTARITALESK